MVIANTMSVIPVACLYGLVLFALIYWYVKWEMNNFKNALCDNILCIMLENGFKPKE